MRDLLSGTAACASLNIMHRDIKPNNLIFKESKKINRL